MTSLAVSRVTGAHALKFGFSNNWATHGQHRGHERLEHELRFNNGMPNQLTMHGTPTRGTTLVKADLGVYVAGSLDATGG